MRDRDLLGVKWSQVQILLARPSEIGGDTRPGRRCTHRAIFTNTTTIGIRESTVAKHTLRRESRPVGQNAEFHGDLLAVDGDCPRGGCGQTAAQGRALTSGRTGRPVHHLIKRWITISDLITRQPRRTAAARITCPRSHRRHRGQSPDSSPTWGRRHPRGATEGAASRYAESRCGPTSFEFATTHWNKRGFVGSRTRITAVQPAADLRSHPRQLVQMGLASLWALPPWTVRR